MLYGKTKYQLKDQLELLHFNLFMEQIFQEKMKNTFDRKIKKDDFHLQDLVLKWDAKIEDKGKHGKFNHMFLEKGPYQIAIYNGKMAYI